jgi:hypothetical protein
MTQGAALGYDQTMNIFKGGRRVYKAIVAILITAGILGFDGFPLLERLQNLALWLVFLGVFTWTVGWIVRGFVGIPHGLDQSE